MNSIPSRAKTVALFGMVLALALVASFIESLIPFYFGVPGMKLGLCNAIVVVMLYRTSSRDALAVNVMRILLAGFMFGNAFSILYSMAGALLSFAVMLGMKKTGLFSVVGVSIAGGCFHNIGQLILAALIVENYSLMFYGPVLIAAGVLTGFLIGVLAAELIPRIGNLKMTDAPDTAQGDGNSDIR